MPTVLWRGDLKSIRPMLATLEDAPLEAESLVYEPKYDGIRALVEVTPGSRPLVRIWSRLGNEKTAQFPDLVAAFMGYAKRVKGTVILDGEIVALDEAGEPAGFQRLQNRIHLTEAHSQSAAGRVAFIAFDVLRDRNEDLRPLPLTARRARLERIFRNPGSPLLRLSQVVAGNGRDLYQQALDRGWEGLIAKDVTSVYHTGKRTRDWRKLKIVHEQEFVVGGWTEARTSERHFGALLLGYYDKKGDLIYAGHSGGGFNQRELDRVFKLLKPLETATSPFKVKPKTNERPYWVRPSLVAQVKFTEWTDEGLLRHPIYLGLRDDVNPSAVRREPELKLHAGSKRQKKEPAARESGKQKRASADPPGRKPGGKEPAYIQALVDQLEELERR